MHKNRAAWLPLILLVSACFAQVVNPVELKDPDLRVLQQKYLDDLKTVGDDILATHFDYPFYLSRALDIDEPLQQKADQRSLRFDRYGGKVVLAISGNYYAAYSTEKIHEEQRARTTFLEVVMPILKDAVPRFQANRDIKGYAVEVSHHITGKVMGVTIEKPENLMVYLPQNAALKLLAAKDDTAKQAALLEGQAFLNAAPVSIWLNGEPQKKMAGSAPPPDTADDQEINPFRDGRNRSAGHPECRSQLTAAPVSEGSKAEGRCTSSAASARHFARGSRFAPDVQPGHDRQPDQRSGLTGALRLLRAAQVRRVSSGNLSRTLHEHLPARVGQWLTLQVSG